MGDKAFLFQFPSNGKVHRKFAATRSVVVSVEEFQFPSNGKVHGKCEPTQLLLAELRVSIPFQRESSWKVGITFSIVSQPHSFNSLQTGKFMESKQADWNQTDQNAFRFPSNGKVHGKHLPERRLGTDTWFQFLSNGKAYPKSMASFVRVLM